MTSLSHDPHAAFPDEAGDTIRDMSALLRESLEALADAGRTETACRIAGQAHSILRRSQPETAHRINVLMHRLARGLTWSEPPGQGDGSRP